MSKLIITKEKLYEILSKENDCALMEYYYQECLKGNVEVYQREAYIALLMILLRYKWSQLFENKDYLIESLFKLKEITDNKELTQYSELLSMTNLQIGLSIIDNDIIKDDVLIEFKNMYASYFFMTSRYLECLAHIDNVITRNPNDSTANFYKSILAELCLVMKTDTKYKMQLSAYQIELLKRCDKNKIHFDKCIVDKVYKIINPNAVPAINKTLKFTLPNNIKSDHWTEEEDFYLRNKLFLNPLNDFGFFAEASWETFDEIPISKEHRILFDSIVEDYKYGRRVFFEYSTEKNTCQRDMISAYSFIYSIFDKIAYLLYRVYDLDRKDVAVIFSDNKLFNAKIKNDNRKFSEINNPMIIPLYYLMKSVREKNKIENPFQVGTFELDEYRNILEHRTTSNVDDKKLKMNTRFLLTHTRRLIIYCYLLLHGADKNIKNNNFSCVGTTFMKALYLLNEEENNKQS